MDLQASLAKEFLFPHLGTFTQRYPGIDLEIGTGDRLVDLIREGVDCVLRAGEPRDTGLASRRVALLPTVTCASREYIAERGRPRTIEQMKQHQAVNYLSTATGRHSPFEFIVDGKVETLMLRAASP